MCTTGAIFLSQVDDLERQRSEMQQLLQSGRDELSRVQEQSLVAQDKHQKLEKRIHSDYQEKVRSCVQAMFITANA